MKQIDPEGVTKENLDEVIDILEGAKDILIENDCAHRDDEDGHYEDAQTLKDEIDAFEEQLRKQTEEQDQKGDQDPNDQKDQGSDDENEEDTQEPPQSSDKESEIRKQLDAIQETVLSNEIRRWMHTRHTKMNMITTADALGDHTLIDIKF